VSAALLMALVFGLAPVGVPDGAEAGPVSVDLEDGIGVDAGVAGVDASADGLAVDAPLVGPVTVGLCADCPLLGRSAADPAAAPGTRADASATDGGLLEGATATEQAAAGTAFAGLLVTAAVWLARAGLVPWLPSFSRIEDDELAKHPTRRQALDFIAANPGATLQDVRRALGIAWGTTVHHLGRLERAGLVAVRRVGGRRGHWPLGQAPARDALPAQGRALAAIVLAEPGLSQLELARLAGIGAPAACKQLRRLQQAGAVLAERAGRTVLYRPAERLDAMLAA